MARRLRIPSVTAHAGGGPQPLIISPHEVRHVLGDSNGGAEIHSSNSLVDQILGTLTDDHEAAVPVVERILLNLGLEYASSRREIGVASN
jgi:hypothetical protein